MRFKFSHILIMSITLVILPLCGSAQTFPLPPKNSDIIGHMQKITLKNGETLVDISKKYEVGFLELHEANPKVNLEHMWPGTELVIPTEFILPRVPRHGIVINLPELRLYYFPPKENKVYTYPVGIGKFGDATPIMHSIIVEKIKDPYWYPTEQTRESSKLEGIILPKVVPPGEDNPLGKYAMRMKNFLYLIHGTNNPDGVGLRISGGCIRMFNRDVEELYKMVKIGTPINIVAQPFKSGWQNNKLYLEAHVPVDLKKKARDKDVVQPAATSVMMAAVHDKLADVNWDAVLDVAEKQEGFPEPVGTHR